MVSLSDWDLKVESSSPGLCTHVVFLGKTLNSHSASVHPGVQMWNQQIGDKLTRMLEGNMRWTSIPLQGG